MKLKGNVWTLGDNISTDLLMPTLSMHDKVSKEEKHKFCLIAERPEFAKQVSSGDFIVAGRNFGCGSSRPATRNLMKLGVSCVIAESTSAIFFRNSISMGFPVIECEGVSTLFDEGQTAKVNFKTGKIENLSSGKILKTDPLPDFLLEIINQGGLISFLRKGKRLSEGVENEDK